MKWSYILTDVTVWAQLRTKATPCCLCQGNVGRSSWGFWYGCSEADVPLDSMGRWRHSRAALPVLQTSWMLPSSGPEVAELGLYDLPSLTDPTFQGNYACERECITVRLCLSTAGMWVSLCVHPAQCSAWAGSARAHSALFRGLICRQHFYHLGSAALWGKQLDFE